MDRPGRLTRGPVSTGISELVAQLGINRATMYGSFGDKEAIYNQALTEYARRLAEDREARLVCPEDPLDGISRWLHWLAEGAENDPTRRGCFIGGAALERLPQHADTATIVEADLDHTQRLLTKSLQQARDHSQIRSDLNIAAAAALLNTVSQGIRVLSKANLPSSTATLASDAAIAALT